MSATTAPTVTLNVTDSAATEIKKFMGSEEGLPETTGLRVRDVPGGCSGFSYEMFVDADVADDDVKSTQGGVQVVVDPASMSHLGGGELGEVPLQDRAGHRLVGFVVESLQGAPLLHLADDAAELDRRANLAGGQDFRRDDDGCRGEMDFNVHRDGSFSLRRRAG